jgi:hypothetical protein
MIRRRDGGYRLRGVLCAAVLLLLPALANAGEWRGTCGIRFLGTSTLHDFAGTARCQPFRLILEEAAGGGRLIPAVEIAVPVEEMDTKNGKRDRQMREMFQSDKFPHIRAAGKNLDPDKIRKGRGAGADAEGAVEFTLAIRGIERTIRAVLKNLRESPERVSFDAEFPVSLKEYGLKPPAPLFGVIRVGDRIDVKAAVVLEAVAPGRAAH